MAMEIIVNGKAYSSLAEMPPDIRAAYQQMTELFADKDGNGVPDIMEGGLMKMMSAFGQLGRLMKNQGMQSVLAQSRYRVDGKEYASIQAMPTSVRNRFLESMAGFSKSSNVLGKNTGSATFGSAKIGSAEMDSADMDSAAVGSSVFGSANVDSATFGSATFGSANSGGSNLGTNLGNAAMGTNVKSRGKGTNIDAMLEQQSDTQAFQKKSWVRTLVIAAFIINLIIALGVMYFLYQ